MHPSVQLPQTLCQRSNFLKTSGVLFLCKDNLVGKQCKLIWFGVTSAIHGIFMVRNEYVCIDVGGAILRAVAEEICQCSGVFADLALALLNKLN